MNDDRDDTVYGDIDRVVGWRRLLATSQDVEDNVDYDMDYDFNCDI